MPDTVPFLPPGGRNFLHTPGPTNVPDRVLAAMQRPSVDLAAPDFVQLTRQTIDDLRPVFGTAGDVIAFVANGHGAWEAALVNTLSPGDRILVPTTGHFSGGWSKMAEAHGVQVETLPGDWRHAIDAGAVEARLADDRARDIKAVLAVQTDTASGVTSDIPAIRRAMNAADHPALLMVDAVASLATIDFRMDEWGVDVAVGASQKGLMCPPGISFNAVGPRARAAEQAATAPRSYWDWERRRGDGYYLWFCGTAPIHLVYGLREAIDMIDEDGLPTIFARHQRNADAARAAVAVWARAGALEFNAVEPATRSNGVTTIRVVESIDARDVIATCRERFNVALGGGLGELYGRCFRIAHMGWANAPMIFGALASVEATLRVLDIAHDGGGVEAAIASLTGAAGPA